MRGDTVADVPAADGYRWNEAVFDESTERCSADGSQFDGDAMRSSLYEGYVLPVLSVHGGPVAVRTLQRDTEQPDCDREVFGIHRHTAASNWYSSIDL